MLSALFSSSLFYLMDFIATATITNLSHNLKFGWMHHDFGEDSHTHTHTHSNRTHSNWMLCHIWNPFALKFQWMMIDKLQHLIVANLNNCGLKQLKSSEKDKKREYLERNRVKRNIMWQRIEDGNNLNTNKQTDTHTTITCTTIFVFFSVEVEKMRQNRN